jgi:phosphoribosyl 1,2-cyclic phosphodiesterase
MRDAFAFAALAEVKRLAPFHHDPAHSDEDIDQMISATTAWARPSFTVMSGTEGATFALSP